MRHLAAIVVLVCIALPAFARPAARRAPRPSPKLLAPKEALFPAAISDPFVQQLVATGRVAPKPNPKDPLSWQRWGNADPWDQAVAVRSICDALSVQRIPIGLAAAILAIARVESGFNPWARNPRSTACGIFQFIKATWAPYGGDHGYCMDPSMNAWAGVKHLTGIFNRQVKRTMPPLEELPDDLQRAEFIYRGLYAFHYHGLASLDATEGGLIDSQLPAENNIQHLRSFFAVLKRATTVPPKGGRRGPAKKGKPGVQIMRAS